MRIAGRSRAVLVGAVAIALGTTMCVLVPLLARHPFADFETRGYDLLVNASAQEPARDVVFVDFDDATMGKLGTFPLPRRALAEVIDRTAESGADLIAVDVVLSEPRSPEDDQKLTASIGRAGNVILAGQRGGAQLPAVRPLPIFCEASDAPASSCGNGPALAVGFIDLPVDDDGVIRRSFLLPSRRANALPFATLVASNFLKQGPKPCEPSAVCLGSVVTHEDDSSLQTFLISWDARTSRVSAQDMLAGNVGAERIKGKIALIGQSAAAANDLRITPLFRARELGTSRLLAGSEIHAAAIETLLHGTAPAVLSPRASGILTFLSVVLVFCVASSLRSRYVLLVVIAMLALVFAIALWLFRVDHVWMRFISLELGLLLIVPFGFAYRVAEERWFRREALAERKQLMELFGRYTSPDVAEEIWRRRDEVILSGEERTVTILFSDIRNFTAITAGRPPAEVLDWLNQYLDRMSRAIKNNNGFLNKFIGDGIMVLYGMPLSAGAQEDACRAVATAIEMLDAVDRLNQENSGSEGRPKLAIGIGIHTGRVMAGNVGSRERLEYSAIGEAVNLASRLESLTKELKTPIVLSPATADLVRGRFDPKLVASVPIRGFAEQISVYTVVRSSTASA